MTHGITLLAIVAMLALTVYTVRSYRKKLRSGCCGAGGDPMEAVEKGGDVKACPYRWHIEIEGMHCEGCAARVQKALCQLEGATARVYAQKHCADLGAQQLLAEGQIRQAVAKAGYLAREIRFLQGATGGR